METGCVCLETFFTVSLEATKNNCQLFEPTRRNVLFFLKRRAGGARRGGRAERLRAERDVDGSGIENKHSERIIETTNK